MVGMEKRIARTFNEKVEEFISADEDQEKLYGVLSKYQQSCNIGQLMEDLKVIINQPSLLGLYDEIRRLIPLGHQMDYDRLIPVRDSRKHRIIQLRRGGGDSLGFAVRGGLEHGIGLFVSHVLPDSQAYNKGLRAGDELVTVNGFTISQAIHEEALSLVKARRHLVLKVTHVGLVPHKDHPDEKLQWKYVDTIDSNKVVTESGGDEGRLVKLYVNIAVGSGLGCSICSGPAESRGIFIQSVRAGSLAEEAGLAVGDQIISVNGTNFINVQHSEALVALKGTRQLDMTIRKGTGVGLFEPGPPRQKEEEVSDVREDREDAGDKDVTQPSHGQRVAMSHVDNNNHQVAGESLPTAASRGQQGALRGSSAQQHGHTSAMCSPASSGCTHSTEGRDTSPTSLTGLDKKTSPGYRGSTDNARTVPQHANHHDNRTDPVHTSLLASSLRHTRGRELDVTKVEKQELNRLRHEYLETHQSDPTSGVTRVPCRGGQPPDNTTTTTAGATTTVTTATHSQPTALSPVYMQGVESKPRFRFQKPVLLNPIRHSDLTSTGPKSPSIEEKLLAPDTFNPAHLFTNEQIDGRQVALVTIRKARHQELGLTIQTAGGKSRGKVCVASVVTGGAVHQQGGVHVGDQLMMVDGATVLDMPLAQVEALVTERYASTRPVMQLVVAKAPSGRTDDEVTYF